MRLLACRATEPVVDVSWLTDHWDEVVLADVRWYLGSDSGREAYEDGHIPGAVFVDLPSCLAGPPSAETGRHPLPEPDTLAACMSELGIGDGSTVVAYDDLGGSVAARLVWLLRALGEEAALLDGGLAAWTEAVETGPGQARPPARFTSRPWPLDRLATIDEIAGGKLAVVDARAAERYRGEVEPVDARAGHIPGAISRQWADNLDHETGRFLSPAELRARYADVADRQVAVYCGSGVNACHDILAMERAGITAARLYPGSWSQWSADPSRPVATGQG